jgi:hypothetical protein
MLTQPVIGGPVFIHEALELVSFKAGITVDQDGIKPEIHIFFLFDFFKQHKCALFILFLSAEYPVQTDAQAGSGIRFIKQRFIITDRLFKILDPICTIRLIIRIIISRYGDAFQLMGFGSHG